MPLIRRNRRIGRQDTMAAREVMGRRPNARLLHELMAELAFPKYMAGPGDDEAPPDARYLRRSCARTALCSRHPTRLPTSHSPRSAERGTRTVPT